MRIAVLLAVLVSVSAHAATDEVRRRLVAAETLFDGLEFESALAQVTRAKALAKDADDDVAISLHEGIILQEMGKTSEAATAFRTALALKQDAELPLRVSPKTRAAFESIRTEVLAEMKRLKPKEPSPSPPPDVTATSPTAPPSVTSSTSGARKYGWIPIAGGAALAGVGAFCLLEAHSHYENLSPTHPILLSTAQNDADTGRKYQVVGDITLAVGGAAILSGILMYALLPSDAGGTHAAIDVSPTGAQLVFSGVFP